MRTATLAAALLVSLAACGGDGGLSLTEPHQLDLEACAPVAADLAGRWEVDEWGCEVRADIDGGPKCDASELPWSDGEVITMVKSGVENYALTIGGETATAQPIGATGYGADLAAGGSVTFTACANMDALVTFRGTASIFAAYTHRR